MPAWFIWTLATLLSWGVWAVLSKALGNALTAEQSQALSTLGLLPILAPLAIKSIGTLRGDSRRGIALAFAGGIITCLGNIAYYAALARGGKAATVASITAISPLVTVLLAVALLREQMNRMQVFGLALSFAAIWLFNVQTERGLLSSTLMLAVPPIVLWGISGFLQKVATIDLAGEPAALAYLGAFIPVGIFLALRNPWPANLPISGWVIVLALGFFLAFGNLAILCAFARGGKAAVISPLSNLYPVISAPVAVLWFNERIGMRECAAIATALLSVVALSSEGKKSAPGALAMALLILMGWAPAGNAFDYDTFLKLAHVPDGFTIELAAGDPQIRFPMFGCFDDEGRLYVTESSGGDLYGGLRKLSRDCRVLRLEDTDGDGRFEMVCVGHDYSARINNEVVTSWSDAKERSASGYIGLQNYNDKKTVRFRNVRIKDLPPGSEP